MVLTSHQYQAVNRSFETMWFLPISILVVTTILAIPLSRYLAWIMNGKYRAHGRRCVGSKIASTAVRRTGSNTSHRC